MSVRKSNKDPLSGWIYTTECAVELQIFDDASINVNAILETWKGPNVQDWPIQLFNSTGTPTDTS